MKKQKRFTLILNIAIFALGSIFINFTTVNQVHAARSIIFPVIGPTTFYNDYEAPRSNGPHHAIDIIAKKRQKLVAAADGTVTFVGYPQPSWGYAVFIRDSAGYTYRYLHINNDTPGTDDGQGGGMNAYGPDMKVGNRVVKGQFIGWVGDSGNAEGTVPHLHFEMANPGGDDVNPYDSLKEAPHITTPKTYPQLANELLPFERTSKIGVSLDMGNFDVDPASELIVGAGVGGGPRVKLYDSNNSLIRSFYAYDSSIKNGIDVAAGDVDGDGTDEIITALGYGGTSRIRVFEANGTKIGDFLAYGTFKGGVSVTAGDIDANGTDEIITGAGKSGGPRVNVFSLDGTKTHTFYAYSSIFKGGIDVTAADVNGSGADEIVTGAGKSGGPRVGSFTPDGVQLDSFYAYDPSYKGGVRVSAGNVRTFTPSAEILTATMSASPRIKMYLYTGSMVTDGYFMEEWWIGSHDVAAGNGVSKAATGVNRRASVRAGLN